MVIGWITEDITRTENISNPKPNHNPKPLQAKPSNTAPFVSPVVDLVVKYHGEGALPRVTPPNLPTAESNLKVLLKVCCSTRQLVIGEWA